MDRAVWEYDSSTKGSMWEDEKIEVAVAADHVLIAEEFRNSIKLPWPRVRELRDMLSAALDAIAMEAAKPVRP